MPCSRLRSELERFIMNKSRLLTGDPGRSAGDQDADPDPTRASRQLVPA